MTHAPEIGAENRLQFSRAGFWSVSYPAGTGFVWYQKSAPNRTLFYFQARNWRARDWNDDLSPVIVYFLSFPVSKV